MTCAKIIQEYNTSRQCWLPVNVNSPFSLCSRCDFQRIEELLMNPESLEPLLNNPKFIELLGKKEHETSILNALIILHSSNSPLFHFLISATEKRGLEFTLKHQIHTHTPSKRCDLYYYSFLRYNVLNDTLRYTDIPWKCWSCLAKVVRHRYFKPYWYRAFSNGLIRNRIYQPEFHKTYLIDCMVSLHLIGKDHAARILFDRYRNAVKNEDKAQTFLQDFLSHPVMIDKLFTKTSLEFIPIAWQKDDFIKRFHVAALKNVKARNYVFKEDLMIKTWAPHRLFAWCFDLDELKDFD